MHRLPLEINDKVVGASLAGRKHTPDEIRNLAYQLLDDGCLTPLMVWKRYDALRYEHWIIIDGRMRYKLCCLGRKKLLEIVAAPRDRVKEIMEAWDGSAADDCLPFNRILRDFKDDKQARAWIARNQLAQRNLDAGKVMRLTLESHDDAKGEAKDTAQPEAPRAGRPRHPIPMTAPIIFSKELADAEAAAVRLLSAMEQARLDGVHERSTWWKPYHEAILCHISGHERDGQHMDGVVDILMAWCKEAERRRNPQPRLA